jgi:hypothetical protein
LLVGAGLNSRGLHAAFFDWCRDFVGLLGGLLFRLREVALETVWLGVVQATRFFDSAKKTDSAKSVKRF